SATDQLSITFTSFQSHVRKWSILGLLNESDIEPFDLKIDFYIKSLEAIVDHEQGAWKERALNSYREATQVAYWVACCSRLLADPVLIPLEHRWLTRLPDVQGYWLIRWDKKLEDR
ncbi:24816_t:CDS:2, partial [Gigaspora rosea]